MKDGNGNFTEKLSIARYGEDAWRQYIDAQATFTAWEDADRAVAEVSGGMY